MSREVASLRRVVIKCPKCGAIVKVDEMLQQNLLAHTYILSRYVIARCPRCGYVFEPVTEEYIYETERNLSDNRTYTASSSGNGNILHSDNREKNTTAH
ncbi:MAG: hypothetical protein GXO26_02560 [Crenarchaeota archaeon]|nr:hypothetical protein [Thermoproteota archaeon]